MISEFKAFLEIIDRATQKREANSLEQRRSRVLAGVYRVGEEGRSSAGLTALISTGFNKAEISDGIELGLEKGWLIDASSSDGMAWVLSPRGQLYIEGLLEEGRNM